MEESANGGLIVALWGFYAPLEGRWLAKKIRQKISEEVKGRKNPPYRHDREGCVSIQTYTIMKLCKDSDFSCIKQAPCVKQRANRNE